MLTISEIQKRTVERLKDGLGSMVDYVGSYGGEIDDDLFESIPTLPAVWVTYGGSDRIQCANTARTRYQDAHKIIVMCAVRSVRSEEAGRFGGPDFSEIGVNQLVDCVKYLLTNQTLGELVFNGLNPKRVRTLFNNRMLSDGALSVFAVEFEALINDLHVLNDGKFPVSTADPSHPDYIFSQYAGIALNQPDPDLLSVHACIKDRLNPTATAPDLAPAHVESITKFGDES